MTGSQQGCRSASGRRTTVAEVTSDGRTDRRTRRRALGWVLAVALLSACSTGGARANTSPNPSANPLAWAPPPCGDPEHHCVDLDLRSTGAHQAPDLDDDTDYRIHLPDDGALVGGITITGGRNVLLVGGRIDLTYPCPDDRSECMGIHIAKESPGSVFVEGVWIHNPADIGSACAGSTTSTPQRCSTGDGIDVNTTNNATINVNTITLENVRVDGISGCSGQGDHSDVFQSYQAPDVTIRIDRVTGVTNCQGLTLDPDLAFSVWHRFPASITVMNTNIDAIANPYRGASYQPKTWWLTYGTGCESGPIVLTNDYSGRPPGNTVPDNTWPDTTARSCPARYSQGRLAWPGTRIEGTITIGLPPGGDFVPPDTVGPGYRSPGYL